jgi:sugar/nucleoside kinase (ribokinase family)
LNEAQQVYEVLFSKDSKECSVETMTEAIYTKLQIDQVLVHPMEYTVLASKHGLTRLSCKIESERKIQTGAGDNLNAGFCLGRVLGFTDQQCLVTAMAGAGSYISLGKSPGTADLISNLIQWLEIV